MGIAVSDLYGKMVLLHNVDCDRAMAILLPVMARRWDRALGFTREEVTLAIGQDCYTRCQTCSALGINAKCCTVVYNYGT